MFLPRSLLSFELVEKSVLTPLGFVSHVEIAVVVNFDRGHLVIRYLSNTVDLCLH